MRSHLGRLVIAGLVVGMSACSWPMSGHGPDRRAWDPFDTIVTPANVAGVTAGWTTGRDQFGDDIVGDGGVVYASDSTGARALDVGTGAVRWSAGTLEGVGPIVRTDTLLTAGGGTDCFLQTRARSDGGSPRTVRFGGVPLSGPGFASCGTQRPLEVGSTVVVSHGGYALDITSSSCGGDRGYKSVRDLTAFDATLAVQWQYETVLDSGCGLPGASFPGAPFGDIASDGTWVFATIPDLGTVQAFPVACSSSCAPAWTRHLPNHLVGTPIVLTDGRVAVADTAGVVTVLDPASGVTTWATTSGAAVHGLAATASALFAPRQDGQLSAYPAAGCGQATCGPTWTATIGHPPAGQAPSVSGDVLWISGTDHAVVAYDARGCGASTCPSLKTLTTTGNVGGPVSIVLGRVLVPTTAGIETFALPG